MKHNLKNILKESVFGALFTLWTAPIDEPKLKLPEEKAVRRIEGGLFFKNLIVGHRI